MAGPVRLGVLQQRLGKMMWRPAELIIASACCAISFPVIGFKEERHRSWLPRLPDQAKLNAEEGTWFHLKKNLLVDTVRADCEWWTKFICFMAYSTIFVCVLV